MGGERWKEEKQQGERSGVTLHTVRNNREKLCGFFKAEECKPQKKGSVWIRLPQHAGGFEQLLVTFLHSNEQSPATGQ